MRAVFKMLSKYEYKHEYPLCSRAELRLARFFGTHTSVYTQLSTRGPLRDKFLWSLFWSSEKKQKRVLG